MVDIEGASHQITNCIHGKATRIFSGWVNFSLNITNIKTALEMYKPCMPAAFLLAVCNFKGFPALKPRQVP